MIDSTLDKGILEILNSYGFNFSHNTNGWDCYYYHMNGFSVIYDQKEETFECFNMITNTEEFTLQDDHITLNSICSFMSNLNLY